MQEGRQAGRQAGGRAGGRAAAPGLSSGHGLPLSGQGPVPSPGWVALGGLELDVLKKGLGLRVALACLRRLAPPLPYSTPPK